MNPSYSNYVLSSMLLYLDNQLLNKTQAFINVSTQLYPISPIYSGITVYATPYSQIVTDKSVINANIMSGVWINGIFYKPGQGNLMEINQDKGQIYLTGNLPANTIISGTYAVKDFNMVLPAVSRPDILLDSKLEPRASVGGGSINISTLTGLNSNALTFPAIFLKSSQMKNTPYAIGGQQKSSVTITAYIFGKSQFAVDSVCSCFADMKYNYCPLLQSGQFPFNNLGGFKDGIIYNYTGLTNRYVSSGMAVLIENVIVTDFNRHIYSSLENITPNCYFGIAEFEVFKDRVPQ